MTGKPSHDGTQFLTVEEAASRLGRSRLRIREAVARGLLDARRDNEGHLRIDLPDGNVLPEPRRKKDALAPEAVLGFLFDEVEELEQAIAERDARLVLLADLLARQDQALAEAGEALDRGAAREARLSGLLERALAHLEAGDARADRLGALTERALAHLDSVSGELDASLGQSARFEALLARALALAEQGGHSAELGAATDRALGLLDDAVARAEAGHAASERTGALLDRALAAGERMQGELAAREQAIEHQKSQIESALAMSERAVDLVARQNGPERRGFFRRLFGI